MTVQAAIHRQDPAGNDGRAPRTSGTTQRHARLPVRKLHWVERQKEGRRQLYIQRLAFFLESKAIILNIFFSAFSYGHELISGHRRLAACKALGIGTLPVIVRDMTDDEAVIFMVDANLQREHIRHSEKAFAYKMKLDALSHQGWTSVQLGQKSSREVVAKDAQESETQIQRYIRLTELIPELLQMVDDKAIAFNPAVELSYLSREQQTELLAIMQEQDCTPSHAQAIQLKKLSQEGRLDERTMGKLMTEEKPNQKEHIKLQTERINRYFPKGYTPKQMEDTIIKLLSQWSIKREHNKDERER